MGNLRLPALELELHTKNTFGTHNLHPYPAKFIPQIPARLIEALSKPGQVVLDPFCGSGTTLVEARRLNRPSFGSDINDLSVMIARSKSATFSDTELRILRSFLRSIENMFADYRLGKKKPPLAVPEFKNRDHWFDRAALEELLLIKNSIARITDPTIREFLLVNLSAIVVKVSRQDSETRWTASDRIFRKGFAFEQFLTRAQDGLVRAADFSARFATAAAPKVFKADAKDLSYLSKNSIDLVVTSPPYMNSFDYYLYHKLRLFILGIDHYSIQEAEIGSRNKHSDKGQSSDVYHEEMRAVFIELRRVMKPKAHAAIVIGDAIYKGDLQRMDRETIKVACDAGFEIQDKFSYDQRHYTRSFTPNLKTKLKQTHVLLFSRKQAKATLRD